MLPRDMRTRYTGDTVSITRREGICKCLPNINVNETTAPNADKNGEEQRRQIMSKHHQVRSLQMITFLPASMSNAEITVLQLNMNKAYNAGIDLLGKINKTSCFLALLQEPYCYKGTLAAIPSRADYIPTIRPGGPRAAIYADKRLKMREVAHLCTRYLAVGVCVIGKKQTLVISAYMDINQNIRKDTLVNILDYRQAKRLGLI